MQVQQAVESKPCPDVFKGLSWCLQGIVLMPSYSIQVHKALEGKSCPDVFKLLRHLHVEQQKIKKIYKIGFSQNLKIWAVGSWFWTITNSPTHTRLWPNVPNHEDFFHVWLIGSQSGVSKLIQYFLVVIWKGLLSMCVGEDKRLLIFYSALLLCLICFFEFVSDHWLWFEIVFIR